MNVFGQQVAVSHKEEISFAEFPVFPATDIARTPPMESGIATVAVIRTPSCSIAISADIPEVLLSRIFKDNMK